MAGRPLPARPRAQALGRARSLLALPLLAGVLLVTACGSDTGQESLDTEASPESVSSTASTESTESAETAQSAESAGLYRATLTATDPLVVRREPDTNAEVLTELAPTTALGSPRVLLAEESRDDWVRVSLPQRPNGQFGWVPATAVQLEPVEGEVIVELAARTLRITLDGELLTETTVAVGKPEHPTPTGQYYVTDRVEPPDPGGTYGAFALGLSAYSPTATEFAGGDGQVGIHGTNEPGSIGQAASHGCIRVPDEAAALLARVPLGTPVTIR